jgi:hypothetical protein
MALLPDLPEIPAQAGAGLRRPLRWLERTSEGDGASSSGSSPPPREIPLGGDMAERSWFYASEGKQQGPYAEQQFRTLVARGMVRADTFVWSEGMSDWQRAGDFPALFAGVGGPPPMPHPGAAAAGGTAPGGAVTAEFGTWGLFGRVLLMVIGTLLIIPAPWVATMLYRWGIERVRVPQRPNLAFTGQPLDIWYVFVLTGLIGYAGFTDIWWLPIVLAPVNAFLAWMLTRWVVANLSSDGQKLPLTFEGSPWVYIGWFVLLYVSMVTIIGWAWVVTAWMRWIGRNIAGTRRAVVFNASGWGVLWRTVLFVLSTILIIPIPWTLAWIARWYVSQFAVVERA